ncbi:hypothetical protein J4443_05180 [Candidatus Woesearchaeota archaeon]|nr:hypothetical protein [Candidatus Woesearchaeota archaeon]
MAKKHNANARGWHHPGKFIEHGTYGKCRLCKKSVKNLEAHMKMVHKEKNI